MVTSSLDDGGAGTLRSIIENAAPGDTVEFQSGISQIDLIQGQIEINKSLTITGSGASQLTIDQATSNSTVFRVDTAATVTMSGLTITGGKTTAVGPEAGGIYNAGALTLTSCTISGNSSGFGGGGIWNQGSLTINDSTFSDESAPESGGAIYNGGTATITDTTFSANSAGEGGAIYNSPAGTLTVTASTLSRNAASDGGAIMDDFGGGGTGGSLTVVASTFASNSTVGDGGAIDNEGSVTTVTDSTFNGNSAALGGAIDNSFGGTATLLNDTISGNSAATSGGGIYNAAMTPVSVVNVANTIIAGDTATDVGSADPDVYGNYAATDHDLIGVVGDATGFSTTGPTASLVGNSASPLNPELGPLADNGGPTQT